MMIDERPQSVEEAGALLGAAITTCGIGAATVHAPPKGMSSYFGTVSVPSSELLIRLYYLRALLRASPSDEPLVAAPSLLAVLMKLLGASTQLAAKNAASPTTPDASRQRDIPPMLSNPLRKLWVECVVLCHQLGEGLSGNARTSLFSFLKSMIALAGMNPRSAKAGGGARIAALDVIGGLFDDDSLAPKIASWAQDALQLCLRALRSSGNGEPSFRISAMRMGCSVAKASRTAQLKLKPVTEGGPQRALLLPGGMEGPAVLESIKVLRQATADKLPEVRSAAATFAAILAPMLVLPPKSRPGGEQPSAPSVVNLDEVIGIALRNIDDEMAEVAAGWSEALARCLCTAIELGQRKAESAMAKRDVEADQDDAAPSAQGAGNAGRNTRNKKEGPVALCKNHRSAMLFLIRYFVKAGGELSAPRAGGSFSVGGRAVRVGLANALVHLLRIQSTFGGIADENGISMQECVRVILKMSGEEASKQFTSSLSTQTLDVTTQATPDSKPVGTGNALFSGSKKSRGDAGLVQLATGNVLRFGISELASETAQLSLLQDLVGLLTASSDPSELKCNAHQLQVILVEISHLLSALGEASASKVEDLVTNLNACLSHPSHGVRHEAAVACGALAICFPGTGRDMVESGMTAIRTQHAELMGVAIRGDSFGEVNDPKRSFGRMFRRAKKEPEKPVDPSLAHQYAIHGTSLMIAIVARDLPHTSGGIPRLQLADVLSVAETLVSCQFNDVITKTNPAVACTCVRAGFGIIAGILATGPVAAQPHTKKIFDMFQKSYKSSSRDGGNFGIDHDLSCVEVVLTAIVAFLSYCSELLLTVPEALSQITIMLEEMLAMFGPEGPFAKESVNPAAVIRLKTAKASLMEAYAWLPSGSFPMAADAVFSFAAQQIRAAIAGEVTCSILPSLVSREDLLLDAKSVSRVERAGQVGGAKEIEESIVILTSETADHGERESVLHFPGSHVAKPSEEEFRKSQILGMFALDSTQPPLTPLHAAVGTWRKPLDVSCSSTVRLLDAAIQAFSATFGLKGGMEQQAAMEMLETLVPPFLTQLASSIGMNTALTERASPAKAKEDNAAVANITAVLLACLKALPLHESTHNVPIGLGPPWMNKAKDLFLTLLPSASNVVRRAAAEGLALLATLGVSEDAHFLQSAVLHSLDEVMQGNQPDGKPRTLPLEPVTASRAGSLLTLACIQRMAQKVSDKKHGRNKGRVLSAEEVVLQAEETLPTLQMMTRILPSVSRQGFRDFFVVQTHALHAFGLLLGYSSKLERQKLEPDDLQVLRKGVELIEDNFIASWTVASADFDAGQEGEKLACEASFLAVLLRLMALLVPSLRHIYAENPGIATRFSTMATIILEAMGNHPIVAIEGMVFFEVLAGNQQLLPPPSAKMSSTDNPLVSCVSFVNASLKPSYPGLYAVPRWLDMGGCLPSARGFRAVLRAIKVMSLLDVWDKDDVKFVSTIFAFLEEIGASRCFANSTLHRSLAAPRASELAAVEGLAVEKEAAGVLRALVSVQTDAGRLYMLLFARSLSAGASSGTGERNQRVVGGASVQSIIRKADETATSDARAVLEHVGQVRWQLKSLSVILASAALNEIRLNCSKSNADSPHFSYSIAENEIQNALASSVSNPPSRLVFHLGGVLSLACTSAVAAVDQAELPTLQLAGVLFLSKLVACFAGVEDPHQAEPILDQYVTQILASVKHSLGEADEISGEAYFRRFYGGCEAIEVVTESELTKDPMAIKRIIRPVIPPGNDTPFFEYGTSFPKGDQESGDGSNATNLVRIGRVWTTGLLLSKKGQNAIIVDAARQLVDDETGVSTYAAAIALDGARYLVGAGATLSGSVAPENDSSENDNDESENASQAQSGFLFDNVHDLDDSVKAAVANTWSSCGCFALRTLASKALADELDDAKKVACRIWVKKLAALMFKGLDDCLTEFGSAEIERRIGGVDSSEVAVNCLYSLRVFVEGSPEEENFDFGIDIDQILERLRVSVLLPALDKNAQSATDEKGAFALFPEGRQAPVIREVCDLLQHVAATANKASSALLMAILSPLDLLQRGSIELGEKHVDLVIATCLAAAGTLISLDKTSDTFVKSMTQVALEVQLSEKGVPDGVNSAARKLLKICLSHKSVEAKDRRMVAHEIARIGDWETWCALCSVDDGLTASGSLDVIKNALLDTQNPDKQLQALGAIRTLVQSPNNPVGLVMNSVGAELLHFFKMYGATPAVSRISQTRRTTACADAMKIVLVAFQKLVQEETPEQVFVAFLMVTFEYLLLMLRYNGLPNHPPPQTESDPALGRMAAQAIVHVARTAPIPFKATLVSMSDTDRAALEFAVRAEMTGYANAAAQAQPKKKLSLKGFKK